MNVGIVFVGKTSQRLSSRLRSFCVPNTIVSRGAEPDGQRAFIRGDEIDHRSHASPGNWRGPRLLWSWFPLRSQLISAVGRLRSGRFSVT